MSNVNDSQVKLCVPYINDDAYIDYLIELENTVSTAERRIYEVYGSLPKGPVGNLRPPESIRFVTPEQMGAHIRKLNEHGIRFNYVLNSELLPMPISEEFRGEVLKYLQTLHDIGVRMATVTIPWLITLMRIHFPDIQIRISIVNEVSTVREALEFEELGAVGVVLDRDVNRDVALLKDIRQQFKGEIELLCNSACVFHCINVHYHGTYSSAVTNTLFAKYKTTNASLPAPYCNFYCRRRFFENPTELIKVHWIRPDDLQKYADMGINLFKIDGRDKEPRYIKTVVKAYLEGHYEGNLFHLLQPEFREDVQQIGKDVACDPDNATPEELEQWTNEFMSESADWHVGISNHDLDGFSDAFFSGRVNCRGNCASCRYCEKFAKRVVIDPTWQRKIVKVMNYNLGQYYGKKQ